MTGQIHDGEGEIMSVRFVRFQRVKNISSYDPHSGYLGWTRVPVSNYLFQRKGRTGYPHTKKLAESILSRSIKDQHETSLRLTKFLKDRDLTFQRLDSDGIYRTFSVPVTASVVPLPKSVFNEIERAAQVWVFSLRAILQDIYGAPSIRENAFASFLPSPERAIFIQALEGSPHYFPMLHHRNMKDYPFFDAVGLDLVLVQDYTKELKLKSLPFRLLELNAGSPSGASNTMNILEGLLKTDPGTLDVLGPVFRNDHFSILRETYRSLGESWTGRKDGIQVILPPGGANGAAPEIHQLSAFSGLTYCDPGQLFQAEDGYVRMRTVGGANPIVTAIYSRVNSDSALFDPSKGIFLRDPETGAPVYCLDPLKPWSSSKPELLCDHQGNPVPLESEFAIPGALSAILNRKLYLGGLNRLLDNKLILPILSEYAAKFCSQKLARAGLEVRTPLLSPPESLPPGAASLGVVERCPKEWVIKAPNRSGGNGVHVLMTMRKRERDQVIQQAKCDPEQLVFQRCVKIGRIPIALKGRHSGKFRFSNRAADLRMWMFFGAENSLPRLTHNALVRFAPEERGALSSIVNTSKGGGYAPFVVVDDTKSLLSISAREAATPVEAVPFQSEILVFAGAQILQVAVLVRELRKMLQRETPGAHQISEVLSALKLQTREVVSFLHPVCMESISVMMAWVARELAQSDLAQLRVRFQSHQAELVSLLRDLDSVIGEDLHRGLVELKILDPDILARGYSLEMRKDDEITLSRLNVLILKVILKYPSKRRRLKRLRDHLVEMMNHRMPSGFISERLRTRLMDLLDRFCDQAQDRLRKSEGASEFADAFKNPMLIPEIRMVETLVSLKSDRPPVTATEWEFKNQQLLTESEHVDPEIKSIRQSWLEGLKNVRNLPLDQQADFEMALRVRHFSKFPVLKRLQSWIDQESNADVIPLYELMRVLPYAAYNLRQFSIGKKGTFQDLFSSHLIPDRIAILSRSARAEWGLSIDAYSGESFARKRSRHGLISDSDRFLWIAREQSPLVQLFTIGHELIHYEQMQGVIDQERVALQRGPISFAWFLNSYAHFLNFATNTLEGDRFDVSRFRKPLFGLADRMVSAYFTPMMTELRTALARGQEAYHQVLDRYGELYGFMMPVSPSIRMKAFKEVVPALENAKNLVFAKECGLRISADEVKSALPIANLAQRERYRNLIRRATQQWRLEPEAIRVIASHQFYGVSFSSGSISDAGVVLEPAPTSIRPQLGYHQTDQQ